MRPGRAARAWLGIFAVSGAATVAEHLAPAWPMSPYPGIMDELAAEHGFTYEVAKADIDEKAIRHEDARHLVLRLAHAKAAAIAHKLAAAEGTPLSGLLITCDQVGLRTTFCGVDKRSCRTRSHGMLAWPFCPYAALRQHGTLCLPPAMPRPLAHGASAPTAASSTSMPCFPITTSSKAFRRVSVATLQVVLHEGQILEKPEDESQVGPDAAAQPLPCSLRMPLAPAIHGRCPAWLLHDRPLSISEPVFRAWEWPRPGRGGTWYVQPRSREAS